ncbi:MAG: biotin--[acetyl-CoA-carboxylase] ligase [Bacteroidota bacterium]
MKPVYHMIFKNFEIIKLGSTGSTNQYASDLLNTRELGEGSVIVAYAQTQGKGQESNIWESEPGKNLTATILLYPSFLKPEYQFQLTKVISLSVCTTLDRLNLPFQSMIKWPNDIYLNSRKTAGILIKNEISGNCISGSIAGLGLNINQETFSAGAPGATSLRLVSGKLYDPDEILTDWHINVAFWYENLKNGETSILDEAYLKRMYLLNQPSVFIIRGEKMTATIKGLAEYGMLLLEGNNGKKIKCSLKEVIFT